MLKMMKAFQRLKRGHKDEKGITGLETAIILIAFVVVASVFAYTVLSAGIFSSQKAKEAVFAGLDKVTATMEPVGSVIAFGNETSQAVTNITFVVQTTGGEAIDMTEPTGDNVVVISYVDQNQYKEIDDWTVTFLGYNDSDALLERSEKAQINIDLSSLDTALGINTEFTLELKAPKGASLIVERMTPADIDPVMDLH